MAEKRLKERKGNLVKRWKTYLLIRLSRVRAAPGSPLFSPLENFRSSPVAHAKEIATSSLISLLVILSPISATHAASLNATASVEIVKPSVTVSPTDQFEDMHDMVPVGKRREVGGKFSVVPDPDNSYQVVKQPWGVEVVYE